jgi:hypothetical protein
MFRVSFLARGILFFILAPRFTANLRKPDDDDVTRILSKHLDYVPSINFSLA